jgi:uncharacterized protein
MEASSVRPERGTVSAWGLLGGSTVVVLALAVGKEAGVFDHAAAVTFGLVFSSIVIEALPFLLIGALVSATLTLGLSDRILGRMARMPRAVQVPCAALAGLGFPVCECGSVPVGRRLVERGLHPAAGITFMLASPILNPIVLGSTWVAYGGGHRGLEMVLGRAGLGAIAAIAIGVVAGRSGGPALLRAGGGHDHHHGPGPEWRSGWMRWTDHVTDDFLFMGRFLVLGAAASALVQTVLPQTILSGVGGAPVLGALTLMGMAIVLSLCSEADAFVAASFTAFPLAAQLAFLVTGPLIDLKLGVLYSATFRRRFLPTLLAIVIPVSLLGSLLFGAIV